MRRWAMWAMTLVLATVLAGCQSNDTALWRVVTYDGQPTLVEKTHGMPPTDLHGVTVVAHGTAADPTFVDAVETATNKTEAQALVLLQSFDMTQGHQVEVLTLTHDTAVNRYWSDPSSKTGRWYACSGSLLSPAEATRLLALPLANTGSCVTQYTLHDGATVVYGLCADMSSDTTNFPLTATGGGEQFFAPDATLWNAETHTSTLNPAVITLNEDVRYVRQ